MYNISKVQLEVIKCLCVYLLDQETFTIYINLSAIVHINVPKSFILVRKLNVHSSMRAILRVL